jgi:hypothetical protein
MCSIASQGSASEVSVDSTCARHFLSKFSMCFDFHSCFALCQIVSFIQSLHVGASRAATGVHDGKALLATVAGHGGVRSSEGESGSANALLRHTL